MKRVFLFILILTVFACTAEKDENSNGVRIIPVEDNIGNFTDLNLSDLAKDIKYIPLEKNSDCILSGDLSLRACGDNFILLDRGRIFMVFDKEGKFIRSVGRSGKGPEEYLSARQFSVDEEEGRIDICSIFDKKMISYSIEGDFLGEFPLPYPTNYYAAEPGGGFHIASYRQNQLDGKLFRFTHLDYSGEIKYRHFEGPVELSKSGVVLKEFAFYSDADKVLVQNAFSDTAYAFKDGKWMPDLFVDLGKYGMPEGWEDDLTNYDSNKKNFVERVTLNREKDYTMVYFSHKGKSYYGRYDHKSKELVFADNIDQDMRGLHNDIDGGPAVKPSYYEDNHNWYFIFQAIDLIEWNKEGKFDNSDVQKPAKNEELIKLVSDLDERIVDNIRIIDIKFGPAT